MPNSRLTHGPSEYVRSITGILGFSTVSLGTVNSQNNELFENLSSVTEIPRKISISKGKTTDSTTFSNVAQQTKVFIIQSKPEQLNSSEI